MACSFAVGRTLSGLFANIPGNKEGMDKNMEENIEFRVWHLGNAC